MTHKISLWKRCRYPFEPCLFLGSLCSSENNSSILGYFKYHFVKTLHVVCVLPGSCKQFKSLGVRWHTWELRYWIWLPCCEMLIRSPSSVVLLVRRQKSCMWLFLLCPLPLPVPWGTLIGAQPITPIYRLSLISSSDRTQAFPHNRLCSSLTAPLLFW